MAAFLRSLGLHLPCEITFKRLGCLLMCLERSSEELAKLSESVKKENVALCKRNWHTENRRTRLEQDIWISSLPFRPSDFRDKYPSFWESAYGTGQGPVDPPIDLRKLNLLEASFKARGLVGNEVGTALSVAATPQLSLQPPGHAEPLPGGALAQMGQMMLQGMQHMANQQSKMMEMMMGASASTARQPPGLRALIDSTNPRWGTPQRAALMDLPSPETSESARTVAEPQEGPQRLAAEARRAAFAAAAQAALVDKEKEAAKGEAAEASRPAQDTAAPEAPRPAEAASAAEEEWARGARGHSMGAGARGPAQGPGPARGRGRARGAWGTHEGL